MAPVIFNTTKYKHVSEDCSKRE